MNRRCLGPGCTALISKGSRCRRCDVAYRGTWRQRAEFRAAVLTHDGFTCQRCGHRDPTGATLEANHRVRLADGGQPLNAARGETLCKPCHRIVTNEQERGENR